MATRGTISIEREDGSIQTVYSHWDNYLSCNGKLLAENYKTREAVEKLIAGGQISSLGSYVADGPKSFNRIDEKDGDDYTVFYSYRGEPVDFINTWGSFDDYERNQQFEEYNYLFTKDNVWSVEFNGEWYDLEYELQREKTEALEDKIRTLKKFAG